MKRPSTYSEWKQIYWREIKYLGLLTTYAMKLDAREVKVDRELYYQNRRVQRIRKRLDVESEVKDITWYQEFIHMMRSQNEGRDNQDL